MMMISELQPVSLLANDEEGEEDMGRLRKGLRVLGMDGALVEKGRKWRFRWEHGAKGTGMGVVCGCGRMRLGIEGQNGRLMD